MDEKLCKGSKNFVIYPLCHFFWMSKKYRTVCPNSDRLFYYYSFITSKLIFWHNSCSSKENLL